MLTRKEFETLKQELKRKVDKKAILKVIESHFVTEESLTPLPPAPVNAVKDAFKPVRAKDCIHAINANHPYSTPHERKHGAKVSTQGMSEMGDAIKGNKASVGN